MLHYQVDVHGIDPEVETQDSELARNLGVLDSELARNGTVCSCN